MSLDTFANSGERGRIPTAIVSKFPRCHTAKSVVRWDECGRYWQSSGGQSNYQFWTEYQQRRRASCLESTCVIYAKRIVTIPKSYAFLKLSYKVAMKTLYGSLHKKKLINKNELLFNGKGNSAMMTVVHGTAWFGFVDLFVFI